MRGTVYPHRSSSGTKGWQLQVDAGRDETGKRIRITKSFQLKREADAELARLLQESQDGLLVRPSPKTVGEFLNEWLREHGKHCERKTAERYSQLAGYVSHALGHVALCDLSTLMLERLYNSLHEAGGKDGRPLSARTVKHIHDTLRCALNTALRWKLLKVNPAIPCQRPKVTRKEARVLENAQLEWLLDAAQRHPWLYALLVVAIATGLRRGELLALGWDDVDLMQNSLTVRRSLEQTRDGLRLKTPKSDRTRCLALPSIAADVLKDHRRAQQQNRDAFGSDYRNDLDLVFASPEGDYLKPNSVSPAVCDLAARCGLKGIGLHSLRHTHGSQLLAAGVPLPTVSKRLGHSSVNVTATVYAHAFAADEVRAAEAWDLKMGASIRRPSEIRQ